MPYYWWGTEEMLLGFGSAHSVSGLTEESEPEAAGELWVPDPEKKGPWKKHVIAKAEAPRRKLGFR